MYAKVQWLFENLGTDWMPKEAWNLISAEIAEEIRGLDLEEEDILSMADLAVGIAGCYRGLRGLFVASTRSDLLCLLKPIEEKLLPPEGPTNWQIWEIFAAAEMQRSQVCLLFLLARVFKGKSSDSCGLAASPLVMSTEKKLADLLSAFQDVQQKHGLPPFDVSTVKGQWSKVASEASEIAQELRSLPNLPIASPKSSEDPSSWSLVEDTATVPEAAADVAGDAGSAASCWSVDSQTSYLSGHGGPHCFLPPYLFQHVQSGNESSSKSGVWAAAKDLQKGAKIVSADGDLIDVIKVEVQKTTKLVELELDQAVPFSTTPNHRIMVPSDGDDATVKAIDLKLGSWVMCSDGMAKKVIGMKLIPVESQEVVAITFHPDKAVACFLPPQEPLILTKGLTPKPIRRGIRRGGGSHELMSVPDTAPGEYED
eukprot:s888_g9.t1